MPKSKVFLRFTLTFLLFSTSLVDATEVTLGWDPNNEPDLQGYRLHYGTRSRTYTTSVNVGNVTRHTVSLPSTGETHFFALTAYNTSLLESDFSNEVSLTPEIDLPDEGPADPTTFSFLPVEDAYLQGTTRFNDAHLKVEAGYRVSYLKFNVSGLSGTVQSAALRLQENGDVGKGTLRVHRGSHNNWTETTLSTANAPAENGQVGTFTGAVTSAQVVSMDVTPLVTGNGTYSVIVKMDAGGNDVWFGSAESSRRPQLIIQTTSGGTQTVAGAFPPQLEVAWDPTAGKWQLIWPGSNWVLQEAMGLESAWTDVHPPASSPYPVATGDDHRFFRLREADQ